MKPDEFRNIIREEVALIVHDQVSLVIEEKVPKMIDERVARHLGIMREWMTDQFKATNELADFRQEKNDRNFAELREDISHIHTILDEHTLDIVSLKKNRAFAQQSWRPS